MKKRWQASGERLEPPDIHIALNQQDREDLERFRELVNKLTPRQRAEVTRRMLEKPDTP